MKNCCDDRDYCFGFHAGTGRRAGRIHRTVYYHYHPCWRLHRAERRGDHRGERRRCVMTPVTLRGKIVERISDDLYKFRDASG